MSTTYDENSAVRMKDLQRGLVTAAMSSGGGSTTVSNIYFGECNTAGDVQAKTVSIPGFTLTNGARVCIKFTYRDTVAAPTLNINNTGAFPIKYAGYAIPASAIQKNSYLDFVFFDGAYNFVGLLAADGDYILVDPVTYDECGNVWTIGDKNKGSVTSTDAKFDTSLLLDYTYLENTTPLALGGQDFTADFWVKKIEGSNDFPPFMISNESFYNTDTTNNRFCGLGFSTSNGGRFWVDILHTSTDFIDNANIFQWNHVAEVYSHNETKFRTFVNGVCLLETTVDSIARNTNLLVRLGFGVWGEQRYFGKFLMDEVRISDGIARWTEDFTPPTEPYTVDEYTKVLMHFD